MTTWAIRAEGGGDWQAKEDGPRRSGRDFGHVPRRSVSCPKHPLNTTTTEKKEERSSVKIDCVSVKQLALVFKYICKGLLLFDFTRCCLYVLPPRE